eukprot:GHVN01001382.1.p1 GENE.GHVN01001382.1~~GHVN01001382.1.p1  ORF type:complete len:2211 (-),score=363.43 GHVN01001382.1:2249-8881(-)
MAEEFEKFRRFEYNKNSNLVLQREGPVTNQNEPTGEPESLAGRLAGKMGDKCTTNVNAQQEIKKKRQRELEQKSTAKRVTKRRSRLDIKKGATVLDDDVTEAFIYRPTTQATRAVYEQILAIIHKFMGDQPDSVLKGAADEMIGACRLDMKDSSKKTMCEDITGTLPDTTFSDILQLTTQITDFQTDGVAMNVDKDASRKSAGGLDEPGGVAVVFDEEEVENEDEEDDGFGGEVAASDSEDDEGEDRDALWREEKERRFLEARHLEDDDDLDESKRDKYTLDVAQVDSHWLQRKLADIHHDPNIVVATEKEILSVLPISDIQQCENKLVMILKYENFEFAKLILKNRWKVYFCTRLGQAQSDDEKEQIHSEMRATPEGQDVIEQLETVRLRRNKEKDFARNVRREAATLAEKADREEFRKAGKMVDTDQDMGGDQPATDRDQDTAGESSVAQLKPSHFVDLEALAFGQGGHFMANARVNLPNGSQRIEKKDYDEVLVPPFKAPADAQLTTIPIADLPQWTHESFQAAKIEKLNPVQSKVKSCAFDQPKENMLVCAPTGAGKTNVAMLCMLSTIQQYRRPNGSFDLNGFKIIYISPMKALVAEQVLSFEKRLSCYGISVKEMTGDISLTRQQIEETQVIITTPEKWDIVTRKSGDRLFTQFVRLVIIDEVHLLHDSRGPVLEAIVARIIRQIETTQEFIRLVGLSATLPNSEDVALFMRVNPQKGLFYFGNHYRPVPLHQTYVGIKDKKAIKRYNTINKVVFEKVMENAGKHQVLVFVHSRKDAFKTARMIREMAVAEDALPRLVPQEKASQEILQDEAVQGIKTPELKELLPYGIGVHHAGLPRTDRKVIEDLFADGHVQLLVSTATLAWGVNLPAHTVIIKGTQVYMPEKGCWCELSPMDVTQMMGRAGRPQYDSSGHGIIITTHSELQYYLSLNNQQLPIESQMIGQLPDMLNAEIVLGTIRTRTEAVTWLGYTYLYVRMLRNPTLYGVTDDMLSSDPQLEQRRLDMAHCALLELDKLKLIMYDKRSGTIQVTALGRVASHYYIKRTSVATYNAHLQPSMSDIELLRLFSLSSEFALIPVREEEKVELAKLMERVPIPVKGSANEPSSKINVLLQAYISKMPLEGFAMFSDMVYVQQSAGRIMRAIFEICLKRGWAALANRSLQFCKMIDKRMWATMTPLRQFKGVSEEILRRLEKQDFAWDRFYDLSSSEVGELVRMPGKGKMLHRLIHQFPRLDLAAYVQPLTRSCLSVELTITPDFQWDPKIHGGAETFLVMVEDVDGETILHHEIFVLKQSGIEEDHTFSFTVPISDPLPPNCFIRLVSDRWLGSETLLPVCFKNLILPEKNPPHTELLDLQPLPLSAMRCPEAESLFVTTDNATTIGPGGLRVFNPVQTQVFSTLYNTNDSVLICAPPGSGRVVCAEFAIIRLFKKIEDAAPVAPSSKTKAGEALRRCVYVAPYERIVKQRLVEWSEKWSSLGLVVNELCGDVQSDLKIIEASNIIVTTPERWDFVSRRWKTRKVLKEIRLFIVDEMHLLDSDVGATLEVCISRMRFISAQLPQPIRIVALACSLANAKDIGEWIGASSTGLFNFHPNVRTIPLDISIHGFDAYHRPSRLLAMTRPTYLAIKRHSPDQQVIIFVTDRKQARLTSIELVLQLAADDTPSKFLHTSVEDVDKVANMVKEKALGDALRGGVGFIHEGYTPAEAAAVQSLYTSGLIQVLVVTHSLCWGFTAAAHLVIIQDTKIFNGQEKRWVDYPVSDLLQIMGRAGRPGTDTSAAVVLLCQSSKKDYFKKFFDEPLPVESHLDHRLADHINAEIVLKTIENKQDAIDWLTWTLYYRRICKNPNYYELQGVSHQHLSDHLSCLVENTVEALEQAQCIAVEDDVDLKPLNLGLIAAFYYIRYMTIEMFNQTLNPNIKRRGLIELLSGAVELSNVPIRAGEEEALKKVAVSSGIRLSERDKINEPHIKALLLIYAHINRTPITTDLTSDQTIVLDNALRLVQGLVDVISSNGWLSVGIMAMELSQMLVQATSPSESPLKQLPHFSEAIITQAKKMNVSNIYDLMNMEDSDRDDLLSGLTETQVADVAKACNRYPVINVEFKLQEKECAPRQSNKLTVTLERDLEEAEVGHVYAPFYPKEKDEQWWLLIGQPETNSLNAIKRLTVNKQVSTMALSFDAPETPGTHNFILYLMADSYLGCDQEYKFSVDVE